MKSTFYQNFLIVLFVIAIALSALLAHTMIPLVAILGGFVGSILISRFAFLKWFNVQDIPTWKKYLIAIPVAAVGSQMGWVALLI